MTQPNPELKVSFFEPGDIKYLVLNVDGVLSCEDEAVSFDVVYRLSQIVQNRHVLLCTGRALPLIKYIDIMFDEYSIPKLGYLTEHGAQYWDHTNNLVWHHTFSAQYAEELITCLSPDAKILFYCVDLGGYALYCPDETQLDLFAHKFERYNAQTFAVKTTDFDVLCGLMRNHQFSILRTSQQSLFPATREYPILLGNEGCQVEVTFNSKHGLWEVFPPKVSKGEMLQKLMAQLHILPQEILFCGNEPADESIFAISKVPSVYVGISSTLQSKATWTVQTPEQLLVHLERMLG